MKRVFAWHWHRRKKRLCVVIVVIACVIGLLGLVFVRCRPVMRAFAESQAVWTVTKLANRTVAQVLQEYAELCADTILVSYDGEQKVSAVHTNTSAVNAVRTAITDRAISAMEEFSSLSVALPMGTLLGWEWFSGLGPLVSFPISFTATVLSDVSTSLVAEGINQSLYQVLVHLEISMYVVSPAGRSAVGTRMSYPMAETVILGKVPDNLTEVYGDDQSLLGQIFDYGTTQ